MQVKQTPINMAYPTQLSINPFPKAMNESQKIKTNPLSFLSHGFIFLAGNLSALLLWSYWSLLNHHITADVDLRFNRPTHTFYDDPDLSYSIERPVKGWDEKRQQWLAQNPWFSKGREERILMLTGSQPSECKNHFADHLYLRFFKNKADYCRIHGYDLFYNNALLHPKMSSFWVKLPLVRAAMLAHPEAEWIWWVDADAVITDMEFKFPLERYKGYNLIVNGYAELLYKEKKWMSVNAGVFLIKNCQWSMDFLDAWASMGPQTPDYPKWTRTHLEIFKDMRFRSADDQSALAYLMLIEKEIWMKKIYLETDNYFNGYWEFVMGAFYNITERDWRTSTLWRRRAEVDVRYRVLAEDGEGLKRPFITHFAGCSICNSKFPRFVGDNALQAMEKALNFADNQVLRSFGYMRRNLRDSKSVLPVPFGH